MKKLFLTLACVAASFIAAANEDYPKVWLKQDFEDTRFFSNSKVENGANESCKWTNLAMPQPSYKMSGEVHPLLVY